MAHELVLVTGSNTSSRFACTVASKILQVLEIICAKKLISNAILRNNICQVMVFRLYTVYNKHQMIKIDNKKTEKSQVLSQGLE